METLSCIVDKIVYQSDSGYSVVQTKAHGKSVTITGSLSTVVPGVELDCTGNWTENKFGRQFAVQLYSERIPATVSGIRKYLGSGVIKGLGPKYASMIVDFFGASTLDIINKKPSRLLEVPGIGAKKVQAIKEGWEKQKDIRSVMLFLHGIGVTPSLAGKIHAKYGKDTISKVKENPYVLADDIWGVGFLKADAVAMSMGFAKCSDLRIRSAILFVMKAMCDEGNVFADHPVLLSRCAELLELTKAKVDDQVTYMVGQQELIMEGESVYLPVMYHCENGTATRLSRLRDCPGPDIAFTDADVDEVQRMTSMNYDEVQRSAIMTAMNSKVTVLTGGPGTGKTTTTAGIIAACKSKNLKVVLAAPTGRAAKRMSETSGMTAKTIHRLLEFNPKGGFNRNASNPIDGDVLIIDECSMIDLQLMYSLLKAIPDEMRLVLVGDIDQLPSVGAGNVLRDIIDSKSFCVVKLTRIFRQAQTSLIVMNAHAVNRGAMPSVNNTDGSDFFFIECDDRDMVKSQIVSLVRERLPRKYGVTPRDIQVLSPMRRGPVGTAELNIALQSALHGKRVTINRGSTSYGVGDRVMQIRNNYDKGVFNGDLGYITDVNTEDREISVDFDGHSVTYDVSSLDELVLAYATTIHKSQGSEYPVVVIPVHTTHFIMLQRNLIYTAITRAKKICVLIGTKKAMSIAVRNQAVEKRNTALSARLKARF